MPILSRLLLLTLFALISCDRSNSTASSAPTTTNSVRKWDFSKSHTAADVPFPKSLRALFNTFYSVPVHGKVRVIFDKDHIFEDTVASADFTSDPDGALVGVDFFFEPLGGKEPVEKSIPFAKTFNLDLDKLKRWNTSDPSHPDEGFKVQRNSPDSWAEILIEGDTSGSVLRLSVGWTNSRFVQDALAPTATAATQRFDLTAPAAYDKIPWRIEKRDQFWADPVHGPVEIRVRDDLAYAGFAHHVKFHAANSHFDYVLIDIATSTRSETAKQAAQICSMLNIPADDLKSWQSANDTVRYLKLQRPDGAAIVEINPALPGYYNLSVQFDWP